MSGVIPDIVLNDGHTIPVLGYGVFEIPDARVTDCVLRALECGYRHIDTAQIYGNEAGVGKAAESSGIPRDELFITSKVWVKNYGYDKTLESVERSLEKLRTDHIDLMLLHRPYFDYKGAWKALETARERGMVRSIGLSNFTESQTLEILNMCNVAPAVDQIELHPYFTQAPLKRFLGENDIATEAWYPLGHGNKKLNGEPLFAELAQKYGKTTAQIILRWHVQSGHIIFPKACGSEHIRENTEIFDFVLESSEMERINGLNKNKPLFRVPDWVQKLQIKLSK